jgi:hypothetical protein
MRPPSVIQAARGIRFCTATGEVATGPRIRRPDWDIDKAYGDEAERLLSKLRSDVLGGRVEVKRDDRAHETGRVYLEYACRSATRAWFPSGIRSTNADTWVFVIDPVLMALPVAALRAICDSHPAPRTRACMAGANPTEGYLVPVGELICVPRDTASASR